MRNIEQRVPIPIGGRIVQAVEREVSGWPVVGAAVRRALGGAVGGLFEWLVVGIVVLVAVGGLFERLVVGAAVHEAPEGTEAELCGRSLLGAHSKGHQIDCQEDGTRYDPLQHSY